MPTWVPRTVTARAVVAAGFVYDPDQDIIYSRMDAWQRTAGYCWSYDVGAPAAGMIIDCEPICFTWGGSKWMIELWKGQYGIETGAEIGVYKTGVGRVAAAAEYLANWYACAGDTDLRKMELSFTLQRQGQKLLQRGPESHWWLTGFKWGVFTEKISDLTLEVAILFKNEPKMQYAFTDALWKMGYQPRTLGQGVHFEFRNPKTPQPGSRSALESTAQAANRALVAKYNEAKAALKLSTNDPNGFDADQVTAMLGAAVRQPVQDAADRVGKVVARGRQVIRAAGQAYDVFERYSQKVWRNRR